MSDSSLIRNKIWHQKLRRINRFGRRGDKRRTKRLRKISRGAVAAPYAGALTAKRIQRKQAKSGSASLSASVLLGWITRWSFIWPRTFLLFTPVSFQQHPGELVAPTLICKSKTRCTVAAALQDWSACTKWEDVRMTVSRLELYTLWQISTRQPSRN